MSIRRACGVLELDRSTYHYKSRRPDQAGLEARIKEICATRVRYGYRRVYYILRHHGWGVNMKKAYRPDDVSVELIQEGEALPVAEPWASMPNVGSW